MKKTIRCPKPNHNDKHPSAVLYTRADGSQWLHCKGCKANELYKKGDAPMTITEVEYDENDYGKDVKQCLNDLDLLEEFERDKGITAEMVYHFEGFVTDKGYVGFPYGKDKEVYRRLIDDDEKPRFINTSTNKGLMGQEILDQWDEVFLVEGLTDWILFKWEIHSNVVSPFGAELSDEQAYLLRGKTVFILFDRDFAGYQGAKQSATKLKEFGSTPIILELPDLDLSKKIDVNYLIHKGKQSFKAWLDDAIRKYKTFDDNYLEQFKNREPFKYYETDIPKIKITEGLYVISGPPKTGKTTAAIALVDCFAQQGGKVLYCNYDSSKDEIIARIASRYSNNYSFSELEGNPKLITAERNLEEKVKQCLKNVKIINKLTMEEIKYSSRYYTHIVVDYFQRVPNHDPDKVRGLEKIMDEFSDLASNEGKTIVGISRQSLSGNPYSGSGSIPYHATATLLLSPTDNDIVSCDINMNRRGETGIVLFKVDYAHQKLKSTKLNDIADEKIKKLLGGQE